MSGWGTIVYKYQIRDITEDGTTEYKGVVAKSYKGQYPIRLLVKGIDADMCLSNIAESGYDRFGTNVIYNKISTIMDVDCDARYVDFGYDDSLYQAMKLAKEEIGEEELNYEIFWADEQHGLLLINVDYEIDYRESRIEPSVNASRKFGCINNINDVMDFSGDDYLYKSGYSPKDAETIASAGAEQYGDEDEVLGYFAERGLFDLYDEYFKPMTEEEFADFINTPLTEYLPKVDV